MDILFFFNALLLRLVGQRRLVLVFMSLFILKDYILIIFRVYCCYRRWCDFESQFKFSSFVVDLPAIQKILNLGCFFVEFIVEE